MDPTLTGMFFALFFVSGLFMGFLLGMRRQRALSKRVVAKSLPDEEAQIDEVIEELLHIEAEFEVDELLETPVQVRFKFPKNESEAT